MSLHVDASAVIFFSDKTRRFQMGIRGGGLWEEVLGSGWILGWVGEVTWERLALDFGVGLKLHSIGFFQPYTGVNLVYYLM